eukprot:3371280-Alexandrium_andersonii.AAC.1
MPDLGCPLVHECAAVRNSLGGAREIKSDGQQRMQRCKRSFSGLLCSLSGGPPKGASGAGAG